MGLGTRHESLTDLWRQEELAGIRTNPDIDTFLKFIIVADQKTNLINDCILKVHHLQI